MVNPDKLLLENAPEPARNTTQNARRYAVADTDIIDISPGGYQIRWRGERPRNLQSGELLAMREEADPRWCVGVLRWIRQDLSELVAGVQLIAPRAITVAARVVQKKGGPTDFARAFLLPEIKAIKQPPTLITPKMPFRSGHKVHIQRQGIQSTAQLRDDVMSTQSFNQFTFRVLDGYLEKPGPRTNIGNQTNKNKHGFR